MSQSDNKQLYVTGKSTRSSKYHTDEDCQYLSNTEPKPVTSRYVEVRELELCKECKDEDYREHGYHLKYINKYTKNESNV